MQSDNTETVVHLALPLAEGSMCPWYGVLMSLTGPDIEWLLQQVALAYRLEDEVDGVEELVYGRTPPVSWLAGDGTPSDGRGDLPFVVHPDWVHRHRQRLVPGDKIPLHLHVAPGHVFFTAGSWKTGAIRAHTGEAYETHIHQCRLVAAAPEAFPTEFRTLASFDPWTAVEVLEEGGLEALGGVIKLPVQRLQPTDLRELLASPEVDVRQRAIVQLGRLRRRA